jgi:hypothetical protein
VLAALVTTMAAGSAFATPFAYVPSGTDIMGTVATIVSVAVSITEAGVAAKVDARPVRAHRDGSAGGP